MVVDILTTILSAVFCFGVVALLAWYIIYTTKSSLAKYTKDLESKLENLEIVNANLAKYNETLLKDLKK